MNSDESMARRRFAKNRSLERYVKIRSNGYVLYQHPKMGKSISFGKDVDAANEVAKLVNTRLSSQAHMIDDILASIKPKKSLSFDDVLDRFVKERIPELDWSKSYHVTQKQRIEKLRLYGSTDYRSTDVLFFSNLIDREFSGDSRRISINLLKLIDRFAVGKGLRKTNVCNGILVPKKSKRKRSRIKDYREFQDIRAVCPAWLQRAMNLSLITLQAREEICSLNLKQIVDGKLRIRRQKTGVYIEIEIGKSLAAIINESRKEALRLGTRRLICKSWKSGKRSDITPDYLTRSFNAAVERSGLYADIDNPPTFHEIRSLGSRMYEEAKYPRKFIQDLMGHKKPGTTDLYLEPDEPKYIKAAALLELD